MLDVNAKVTSLTKWCICTRRSDCKCLTDAVSQSASGKGTGPFPGQARQQLVQLQGPLGKKDSRICPGLVWMSRRDMSIVYRL